MEKKKAINKMSLSGTLFYSKCKDKTIFSNKKSIKQNTKVAI
jgi:hypothetical protein